MARATGSVLRATGSVLDFASRPNCRAARTIVFLLIPREDSTPLRLAAGMKEGERECSTWRVLPKSDGNACEIAVLLPMMGSGIPMMGSNVKRRWASSVAPPRQFLRLFQWVTFPPHASPLTPLTSHLSPLALQTTDTRSSRSRGRPAARAAPTTDSVARAR